MNDLLERFSAKEQNLLTQLSAELHLSFSNNKLFLIYIYEILRREPALTFNVLLESLNFAEILKNNNIQGKRKGEVVLDKLFERRFPETAELIRKGEFNV